MWRCSLVIVGVHAAALEEGGDLLSVAACGHIDERRGQPAAHRRLERSEHTAQGHRASGVSCRALAIRCVVPGGGAAGGNGARGEGARGDVAGQRGGGDVWRGACTDRWRAPAEIPPPVLRVRRSVRLERYEEERMMRGSRMPKERRMSCWASGTAVAVSARSGTEGSRSRSWPSMRNSRRKSCPHSETCNARPEEGGAERSWSGCGNACEAGRAAARPAQLVGLRQRLCSCRRGAAAAYAVGLIDSEEEEGLAGMELDEARE
eukprot:7388919-Prymnesium_polylepis.2